MWCMTTIGFFSFVCEHANPHNPGAGAIKETIIVRARVRAHLEALKAALAGHAARPSQIVSKAEIIEGGGTDYPFRIKMSAANFPHVLAFLATKVDYDNFKGAVTDHDYHEALMGVWSCMRKIEPVPRAGTRRPAQH